MILIPIILGLLVIEEIIHRLNRGSFLMNIDLAGTSVEKDEAADRGGMARLLSWIRMIQLILLGFLFAFIAAHTGVRLMYTPAGQLACLLLLMQVMRILNRKVINQWAVLGVTVVLQGMLLVVLLITGLSPTSSSPYIKGEWLMSMASFVVLFLLTVTIPFASTYYLRYLSREGSSFYYFLPPLIYSEYWIRRFTRITTGVAMAVLIMLVILTISYQYPLVPSLVHMLTVMILLTAVTLFRNASKMHHPAAISLVVLVWLVRLIWLLSEASTGGTGHIA
jgi:hypothetical protein